MSFWVCNYFAEGRRVVFVLSGFAIISLKEEALFCLSGFAIISLKEEGLFVLYFLVCNYFAEGRRVVCFVLSALQSFR